MAMWNDYEKIARRLDRIAKAFERIANALETANIIEADRKTEPMKTTDYCDICKRDMCEDCIADATNPYCVPSHYEINYEPKDEPKTQMKTQNSNLTFEKDECAKEYEELGLKELKALIEADRKDEPTCDTCRHKGVEGCEQPCLGCGCCGLYEAMTGNDKLKEKVVEFIKSCARCKHRPIGAMMCEESCHYEPKDEPQTDLRVEMIPSAYES